ncbi:MAG TPA: hypothetical protein VF326_14240 [Anaerolineaceae bacterium]
MDNPPNPKLKTIAAGMLTPLVRHCLEHPEAGLIDWEYTALQGGSFNSEIYLFTGNARVRGEILPWSMILKIIRSPDGKDEPASLTYWKREALAYQSGLLDQLPGILCTPRCFGIVEQSGLEIWLWLEKIVDEPGGAWSLDQYGHSANHLGLFNGVYFENRTLPQEPWLSKGRLRAWVGDNGPEIPPNIRAHPLVARAWPNDIYERMLRVWSEHETWIGEIERQPQTLSHLDAFRRNLFSRPGKQGRLQTVLIDWAFVGSAAPGEEIAPLVAASLNFLDIDISQASALDQVVFEGYLEGLREAGWRGDPHALRSTYVKAAILRYCIGVSGVAFMVADENKHTMLEQVFGHPLDELVDVWGKSNRFLFQLIDRAGKL